MDIRIAGGERLATFGANSNFTMVGRPEMHKWNYLGGYPNIWVFRGVTPKSISTVMISDRIWRNMTTTVLDKLQKHTPNEDFKTILEAMRPGCIDALDLLSDKSRLGDEITDGIFKKAASFLTKEFDKNIGGPKYRIKKEERLSGHNGSIFFWGGIRGAGKYDRKDPV